MTSPSTPRYTTSCKNGHPWPEFAYVKPNGDRFCRACCNDKRRIKNKERRESGVILPHVDPKIKNASAYDMCVCGAIKARASKTCRDCWKKGTNNIEQPTDASIRHIALTNGLGVAVIDAEDYDRINEHRWGGRIDATTGHIYAYRCVAINGRRRKIYMHREILGLSWDDPRKPDHIDTHATLDNRKANLRLATNQQNNFNHGKNKNNTSGYKGVRRTKSGHFIACIGFNNGRICLGTRKTAIEAARLYAEASVKLYGEFAHKPTLSACGVLME